jgi:hypothetical protein
MAHLGPQIDSAVYNGTVGVLSQAATNALDNSPYLIELGSHIEIVDCRWPAVDTIEADEWVNFEVGKVEIDVDGVEADKEIN